QTLCEGGTISLSVTASGTGLTYEWFQDATSLGAPTSSNTLTINNATSSHAGNYTVVVRGTCDATGVTSAVAAVVIHETPEITSHPTNQTICENTGTTFTVNAGVTSGASYQWQVSTNGTTYTSLTNDAFYSGVTTATLTLTNTPLGNNGYLYRARITGSCAGAEVFSNVAILTVQQSPVITTAPSGQTLCEGGTISLSVTAVGTGLTYEWFQDATSLGTPTSSNTFTINNATSSNAGNYTVVVRGTCNATGVTSAVAAVVIHETPEITSHPTHQTICENTGTALTVNAGVTSGASYQWQVSTNGTTYTSLTNDAFYSGVTTATLTLTSTPLGNNGYLYRARVTGSCTGAEVFSNVAILTVQQSPVITTAPSGQTLCEGGTISLNVTAVGTGLTYEWFQDAT